MHAATTVVVLLAALTFSYAADKIPTETLQKVFNEADCDKDQKLSLKEVIALAAAYGTDEATATDNFNKWDTQKDQAIDFAEYETAVNSGCCSVTRKPDAAKLCA